MTEASVVDGSNVPRDTADDIERKMFETEDADDAALDSKASGVASRDEVREEVKVRAFPPIKGSKPKSGATDEAGVQETGSSKETVRGPVPTSKKVYTGKPRANGRKPRADDDDEERPYKLMHMRVQQYFELNGINLANITDVGNPQNSKQFSEILHNKSLGVFLSTPTVAPFQINADMVPYHIAGTFALISILVKKIPFSQVYKEYNSRISTICEMAESEEIDPNHFKRHINSVMLVHSQRTVQFLTDICFIRSVIGMKSAEALTSCNSFMNGMLMEVDIATKTIKQEIAAMKAVAKLIENVNADNKYTVPVDDEEDHEDDSEEDDCCDEEDADSADEN